MRSKKFGQKKGWDDTRKGLNGELAKSFDLASESWRVDNGALSDMLKLREEVFRKRQGELLDFIGARISAKKEQLQKAKNAKKAAPQAS